MLQWIRRHFIFCDPISVCNASQSLLVACGMKGHSQTLLVVTQGRYHLPLWPLMNKLESQDSINWYQSSCCSASPCGTARGLHCSWTWMATAFRNSSGNFVMLFPSSIKSTKLRTCLPAKTFFKISNPLSIIGNAVRKTKYIKLKQSSKTDSFTKLGGSFQFSHASYRSIKGDELIIFELAPCSSIAHSTSKLFGLWWETPSPVLLGGKKGKVGHSFIFELSHEEITAISALRHPGAVNNCPRPNFYCLPPLTHVRHRNIEQQYSMTYRHLT